MGPPALARATAGRRPYRRLPAGEFAYGGAGAFAGDAVSFAGYDNAHQ